MAAQDYEQVTYNSPTGAQMGASASELIAFHGATPTDQFAFTATQSIGYIYGSVSASAIVGFSSVAAFSNTLTLLNNIQALLVEKGLMASS